MRPLLTSLFILLLLGACTSLKPYERVYVNDPEMDMRPDAGQRFQMYVHSIREGAKEPGSKTGSGGCGCN